MRLYTDSIKHHIQACNKDKNFFWESMEILACKQFKPPRLFLLVLQRHVHHNRCFPFVPAMIIREM